MVLEKEYVHIYPRRLQATVDEEVHCGLFRMSTCFLKMFCVHAILIMTQIDLESDLEMEVASGVTSVSRQCQEHS